MKLLMCLLLAAFISSTAFANDEETKEITAVTEFDSYTGIMVRTAASPKKFILSAKLGSTTQTCTEEGNYTVTGPDPSCGQGERQEYKCSTQEVCDWDYSVSPPNYVCAPKEVCGYETVTYDLSCERTVWGCVAWKDEFYVSGPMIHEVDIGKLPKLTGNQTDSIQFENNRDRLGTFVIKNPEGKSYRAELKYSYKCKDNVCRYAKIKIKSK